jgi:hypothetical protein
MRILPALAALTLLCLTACDSSTDDADDSASQGTSDSGDGDSGDGDGTAGDGDGTTGDGDGTTGDGDGTTGDGDGTTGDGDGDGSAITIDMMITVDGQAVTMSQCTFDTTPGAEILARRTDTGNSRRYADIICNMTDPNSVTGGFSFNTTFYADAVGTIQSSDLMIGPCGAGGCDGTANLLLSHIDPVQGVFNSAQTDMAESTNHTGTYTIDSFDDTAGTIGLTVDVSFEADGVTYAANGTVSGFLYDCADTMPCGGAP